MMTASLPVLILVIAGLVVVGIITILKDKR